ncbi:MAG: helix-turn-helix transcriptional regulator [Anaerolineae bacterium]|nr:helix-turn-helix transcriptional regulator [Anaerolineae bacterium]
MPGRGRRWRQRGYSRRAVRFLEPTLLLLLHYGPGHGYTLIDGLEDYGLQDVDTSAVYRALRGMEEKGWVASSWDEEQTQGPPRRVYRLTELGDEVLRWWTRDLQETKDMIDTILGTYQEHMEEGEGEHH